MNAAETDRNGMGMNADTSYSGLDDSWFVGGTTEAPRKALSRAEVMAEFERRRAHADARSSPDDVDVSIDIEEPAIDLDLQDSWFDRPARSTRRER